jgi:catechol 2,3-dioxygenase-like lactoylglutathione lyase family enzyme
MLKSCRAIATAPVKDLSAARKFYEDKLGLIPETKNEPGTMTYQAGGAPFLVYQSEFAGTNRGTAVTWDVGQEIEALAKTLARAGVQFEHYEMTDAQLRGDVYVSDHMKVAWFKDLDGNIHALTGV